LYIPSFKKDSMMKIDYLNLLKFSVALGTAAVLSLGSAANADIFDGNLDTDGGDGVTWEDPLNWAADAVPLNNNSNILINGGHDVVYDGDTWTSVIPLAWPSERFSQRTLVLPSLEVVPEVPQPLI
jgi:hypothetical protein